MRALRLILLFIFTLLLWLAVQQYFFCPRYHFIAGKPFSGAQIYNPYKDIDSASWIKCNFHAHTNAWKGLTNGRGTAADIWQRYDSLGYTVHCVSDYEAINKMNNDRPNYVPAYEHGYNVKKTHELVLGANKVTWLDYVFPQTVFNKQKILQQLSANPENVIILNHPAVRNGFTRKDLRFLSGYNCIEVLNPAAFSFSQWDAALSAGKPVFCVGDDDTHNVFDDHTIGNYCTWLSVPSVSPGNIIAALKLGHGFSMRVPRVEGEGHDQWMKRLRNGLPGLKNLSVSNDTIRLSLAASAREIQFIGQGGITLLTASNAAVARYVLNKNDCYVRIAVTFSDDTEIFLNPLFRYSSDPFSNLVVPQLDRGTTFIFFVMGIMILLAWLIVLIRILRRTPRPKKLLTDD